jgi:hypothetical protein
VHQIFFGRNENGKFIFIYRKTFLKFYSAKTKAEFECFFTSPDKMPGELWRFVRAFENVVVTESFAHAKVLVFYRVVVAVSPDFNFGNHTFFGARRIFFRANSDSFHTEPCQRIAKKLQTFSLSDNCSIQRGKLKACWALRFTSICSKPVQVLSRSVAARSLYTLVLSLISVASFWRSLNIASASPNHLPYNFGVRRSNGFMLGIRHVCQSQLGN